MNDPVISTKVIQFSDRSGDGLVSATGKASGSLVWSGGKLYVSDVSGVMKIVTSA